MRFYPSVRDHTLGCLEGKGNGMGEAADRVGRGGTPPPPGHWPRPSDSEFEDTGLSSNKTHTHNSITETVGKLG